MRCSNIFPFSENLVKRSKFYPNLLQDYYNSFYRHPIHVPSLSLSRYANGFLGSCSLKKNNSERYAGKKHFDPEDTHQDL
jgi:hypothetical protein